MRSMRRELAPCLVLLGLTGVCFFRLLLAPDSLIVDAARPSVDHAYRSHARGLGNDLTMAFLPRFEYLVRNIARYHHLPMWDNSGFAGRPMLGNSQAGLFYPPVWVAWLINRQSALGWLTIAHLWSAGVGTYVLCRALGLGRSASTLAGGCFQACPYLIAHTFEGHYPHVWSASWYPWAFWAFLLVRRRRPLGAIVLPIVLGLSFLAGHPQEWYFLVVALAIGIAGDVIALTSREGPGRGAGRAALWVGLVGLSVAICAVEILPQIAVQPWTLEKSVMSLGRVTRYHLRTVNLFQLLHPLALGRPHDYFGHDNYWETVLSIGLAPLVLGLIGATHARGGRRPWAWIGLVLVAVVFAAGPRLGLYAIAYDILPGLDRFRVPSRTLFLASLGASVLAGLGLEALLEMEITRKPWESLRRRVRCALVVVALAVVALQGASPGIDRRPQPDDSRTPGPRSRSGTAADARTWREGRAIRAIAAEPAFWVALGGMVLTLSLRTQNRGRLISTHALAAIALIELAWDATSVIQVAPPRSKPHADLLSAALESGNSGPAGPYRIAALEAAFSDLDAELLGLEKTNVNDTFQIQHAADLYESLYPFLDPAPPPRTRERPMDSEAARFRATVGQAILDRLCVRFLITDRLLDLPRLEIVSVDDTRGPSAAILWNPDPMPRAYLVPRALDATFRRTSAAAELARVDPREVVLLTTDHSQKSARRGQNLPSGMVRPTSVGRRTDHDLDSLAALDSGRPGNERSLSSVDWSSDDPDRVVVRVDAKAPGYLVVANTWMPGWSARIGGSAATVHRGNHAQQVIPIDAGRYEVTLSYTPPRFAEGLATTAAAMGIWMLMVVAVGARLTRDSRDRPAAAR